MLPWVCLIKELIPMGTDPFRGHCLCSTRTHFPYCCTTSLLPAQENCWFVGVWITQRRKGSLVHLLTRDIGQSWTIFSVLLQDRAVWCSMLFSAPKCVTRHWQRALSRNIPAWTTVSLSLPPGGRNVSLLQHHEQDRDSNAPYKCGRCRSHRRGA